MSKERRKFADDGWAVWIDGDDTSTVYINDWINPRGKSYVDIAIRVRGVKSSKTLHVHVPFPVSYQEQLILRKSSDFMKKYILNL